MKYIHVFVDVQRIGLLRKVTRPNGTSGQGIPVLFVTVRFQCKVRLIAKTSLTLDLGTCFQPTLVLWFILGISPPPLFDVPSRKLVYTDNLSALHILRSSRSSES
jgi:hypothetical protein